jgi:predicted TIM-barrel fold metal-dependent hydrolase
MKQALLCTLLLPAVAARPVVDAHVHITSLSNGVVYPWASPPVPPASCPCAQPSGTPCGCDWTATDYANATSNLPAAALVFVEVGASPASWLVEAQWVQSLADAGAAPIGAIVAGAPPSFCAAAANYSQIAADLDALAALPLARGIRAACLNFSDAAGHGARVSKLVQLAARGLSLDVITPVAAPGVAASIAALAAAVPPATIVLDHVGSPNVKGGAGAVAAWAAGLKAIAAAPNVFVKLGGVLQYFKDASGVLPGADVTAPFVLGALDAFGFERVLYEGNCSCARALGPSPPFPARLILAAHTLHFFAGFFCNWYNNMGVANAWPAMLDFAVQQRAPTEAQLDALYAGNSVRAYRVKPAA